MEPYYYYFEEAKEMLSRFKAEFPSPLEGFTRE